MSRTRQRLLFLAVVGLVISSFALIVLQSTMGGLQHKLMRRSKSVTGDYVLNFKQTQTSELEELKKALEAHGIVYSGEFEIEMMIRSGNYLAPAVIHGVSNEWGYPSFIESSVKGILAPYDIAHQIRLSPGEMAELISPAHVDSFFGDVPRTIQVEVEDIISTDVPEIDSSHVWVRLANIQNMVRSRSINRIRLYTDLESEDVMKKLGSTLPPETQLISWEKQNSSLVYALRLESTVMVFLFVMMTMLVSLCITSGLLIFFNKVKTDLTSFWVLGAHQKMLFKYSALFLFVLSLMSVVIGLGVGGVFLFVLDQFGVEIMPDVFVDRKIPVKITTWGVAISFFVPLIISFLFGTFSLLQFRKTHDPMDSIRSVG